MSRSLKPAFEAAARVGLPVLAVACLIAIWAAVVNGLDIARFVAPRPGEVGEALGEYRSTLVERSFTTFVEAVGGFALGSAIAFVTAVVTSFNRATVRGFLPLAVASNAIPLLVFAPAMVLIFGAGAFSKIVVVALVSFFPVYSNTLRGLDAVDDSSIELMRSLGASRGQILRKTRIPTAAPYVFSALKTVASVSVGAALVAEYFGAGAEGIGAFVTLELRLLDLAPATAAIAVVTAFGMVLYAAVLIAERLLTPWQPAFRRRS